MPKEEKIGGKRLKKILVVSLVVIVALLSALPAVAMIANKYELNIDAGRSFDESFGSSGKAEYCEKSGHPDCDDDGDDDDKDDDKDKDKGKDKDKDKDKDKAKDDKDKDKDKGKDKDRG
jgi:hypothetical protein